MIKFNTHPAAIGVAEGVQSAFSYLQTSWQRWLPAVLVSAVVMGLLYLLIGTADANSLYYIDSYTGEFVWYSDATGRAWQLGGVLAASSVITMVAGWIFTATAIAGLRNRPLTVSFVVVRGLLSLVATVLLGALAFAGFLAWVVVVVAAPGLGLLLMFALVPIFIYLVIRLVFFTLAIFDGFGPLEGIRESWRLSQRSVIRLFGWGLMAILMGIGFSLVGTIASLLFIKSLEPVGGAISSGVGMVSACFTTYLMAVLYESERARHDPATYGYAYGPGYPPSYPGGPFPYGPYPYAPAPYPGAPAPYPGSPAPYPYAPAPYPGAAGPYPGWPSPYPVAPTPQAGGPAVPPPYPGNPAAYPPGPAGQAPGAFPYQGAMPGYPGSTGQVSGWVSPYPTSAWQGAQAPAEWAAPRIAADNGDGRP